MQKRICFGEANIATDSKDVWHRRLGHMSEKTLQMLAKNHLPNIKGQILESCTECIYGKQCKVSFQRLGNPSRIHEVLELVHTNVCAPSKKSLGGAYYFVTFIDDHSRRVWVYLLKTKDQLLSAFKEFHALVECETRKKLKCLKVDNGGEYRGPFDAY